MALKIDVTLNGKDPHTFDSTDAVRRFMNVVDAVVHDTSEESEQASPSVMVPSPPVSPGEYSLVPRDEDPTPTAVTSPPVAEDPEPTRKEPSNRINRDIAMAVYQKLARYGKRRVKSSTFRVKLVAETGCSEVSAQHWVWKLNQILPDAGKIRLDHKRIY